jgi:hypothetical protein
VSPEKVPKSATTLDALLALAPGEPDDDGDA